MKYVLKKRNKKPPDRNQEGMRKSTVLNAINLNLLYCKYCIGVCCLYEIDM